MDEPSLINNQLETPASSCSVARSRVKQNRPYILAECRSATLALIFVPCAGVLFIDRHTYIYIYTPAGICQPMDLLREKKKDKGEKDGMMINRRWCFNPPHLAARSWPFNRFFFEKHRLESRILSFLLILIVRVCLGRSIGKVQHRCRIYRFSCQSWRTRIDRQTETRILYYLIDSYVYFPSCSLVTDYQTEYLLTINHVCMVSIR